MADNLPTNSAARASVAPRKLSLRLQESERQLRVELGQMQHAEFAHQLSFAQYSSGSRIVVTERSASVMIQTLPCPAGKS